MLEQAPTITQKFRGVLGAPSEAIGVAAWTAVFGFVVFLLWGTGFATDDYVHLLHGLTRPIADNWWPTEYISVPVLHYTHALPYFVIGDHAWAYDVLKAVYDAAFVYFGFRFFRIFCPPRHALLLAFLFVFLPLHDAATYSLSSLHPLLSFGAYLYAYALGAEGRVKWSAFVALVASFSSYGSPPIALGLAVLAITYRRRDLALSLLLPNAVYVAYYLVTSLVLNLGTQRLTGQLSLPAIGKEYLLEIVTFLDAAFGISGWAKEYYSIASLDVAGVLVAAVAAAASALYIAAERRSVADPRLVGAALVILLGSFGMFTLTGLYPQLAFGLGDRVMVYGSFFLVCLFASVRLPRGVDSAVVFVLLFAIVGISTHWKQWTRDVNQVAANIRANEGIRSLPPDSVLFVSHHQYSRLGRYAHIEFFTDNYVIQTFFKLQLGKDIPWRLYSLNRRLEYADGALRDHKYDNVYPVTDGIWVYDSRRDVLEHIAPADIQSQLAALPNETRHWTQELPDGWLRQRLLEMVPRLSYAYQ